MWLGKEDPLITQEGLRQEDPVMAPLEAVLEAWAEAMNIPSPYKKDDQPYIIPDAWLTVKELIGINYDPLFQALRGAAGAREGESISAPKVGNFLKLNKGRIRNGIKLTYKRDKHNEKNQWRLEGWKEFLERRWEAENQGGRGGLPPMPPVCPPSPPVLRARFFR